MDKRSFSLLEFIYFHEPVHYIRLEPFLQQDKGEYQMLLRQNLILLKNKEITITHKGRELVETYQTQLTDSSIKAETLELNRKTFALQQISSKVQQRLEFLQYALGFIAFLNLLIAIKALCK